MSRRFLSRRTAALPPFRAAILDMDGLVLDSESTYCHAWRLAAGELGFELSEEFCHSLFGRHADDVEKALRDALGEVFERERFHRSAERQWRRYLDAHGMDRMPGLEALLAVFRRRAIPYALATNSDGIYARECLKLSGVESDFPVIVTRDQVRRGKPAPDVFLEAAHRLNMPPELCLGLEDSETGLEAARAAGTITVLVQRREEVRLRLRDRARFDFASLGELAEWIEAEAGLS
jgi:beta-phosphoglucomutase